MVTLSLVVPEHHTESDLEQMSICQVRYQVLGTAAVRRPPGVASSAEDFDQTVGRWSEASFRSGILGLDYRTVRTEPARKRTTGVTALT